MPDMEKLTINLSPVDVGQIELLVDQGFYANRAELIRVAIHNQLARHSEVVRDAVTRQSFVIGAMTFGRKALERHRAEGTRVAIRVVGFLSIDHDVPADLASDVIESVAVHGIYKASPAVKEALADRTA